VGGRIGWVRQSGRNACGSLAKGCHVERFSQILLKAPRSLPNVELLRGGGAKMPVNWFFQFVIFRTSSCGFHHDSAMLISCSPATKLVPFTVAQLGKTTVICEKIR
jgi:hypothetical protein